MCLFTNSTNDKGFAFFGDVVCVAKDDVVDTLTVVVSMSWLGILKLTVLNL
jgi:hypothetical protein